MESIIKEMLIIEINNILKEFSLSINKYLNNTVLNFAYTDLKSFAERDPSSNHDMLYILKSYSSYHAVLIYRIAHSLFLNGNKLYARKLSEYGKIYTGIEIHPNANIGKYFVLDHGVGTVIGETTIIGNYCYILQSVILGSSHIANNKNGQRHPIIGNNVEIGGFVRIYGSVKIGDNVKISPGAIIKNDIPANSKIIVASNYQITQGKNTIYYTGYVLNDNKIILFFDGKSLLDFENVSIYINNHKQTIINMQKKFIEIIYIKNINTKNIKIYSQDNLLRIDFDLRI